LRRRLPRMVRTWRALLTVPWLLCASAAAGQSVPSSMAAAELTVFHAIFGPGDAVWEKFGHNAIWIHDASTGSTISYNYGMFDFGQVDFIPRLMKGAMLYSMGVRDADEELAVYAHYNRTVTLQRLNLTVAQATRLREFLEWNWLPENRDYLYDYFRDNCSTRVRDALDAALDGAIGSTLRSVPTGTTYRWHSLRLTEASLPTYTGLLLGLGQPTDQPIDAWQEGFIPMQLGEHLRAVQIVDPAGGSTPLVLEESVLFQAQRPPPADAPPNRTAGFLLVGLLGGAGVALLGRGARRSRRTAFTLAISVSLWGIVTGFFGVILTLLWTATNHIDSYVNLNLLQVSPLGLLLAAAAPLAVLRRTTGRSHAVALLAWPVAVTLAVMSLVGLMLRLTPLVEQVNGPIIALVLPIHVGVVLAVWQAISPIPSPEGDGGATIALSAPT
jgi:hypothetical protein